MKKILIFGFLTILAINGFSQIRVTQIEPIQGTYIKSLGQTLGKVLTANGAGGATWKTLDTTWNAAFNDKINSATWDEEEGDLYLNQQDGGSVIINLDGRYIGGVYSDAPISGTGTVSNHVKLDTISTKGAATKNDLLNLNTAGALSNVAYKGNLTNGYVPFYQSSSTSLQNSNLYYSGSNVGIGTASPSEKLDVSGKVKVQSLQSTVTGSRIYNSGTAPFQVASSKRVDSLNVQFLSGKDYLYFQPYQADLLYGEGTSGYISKYYGYSTMLANSLIYDDGTNIGIGTETPSEKLDVVGKTKTTTFQMTTNPSAGYFLKSDADGNGSWAAMAASLVYKGTWNANTNTPELENGTGTAGWYYRCVVADTVDFGAGDIIFAVGDDAYYNGSIWERIPAQGYTLQAATGSVLGGIKVGSSLNIASEVLDINDGDKGDITVSSTGTSWAVEDDSHSHVIGDIDNLQDSLLALRAIIDSLQAETGYLPITGGTLTGSLAISQEYPQLQFNSTIYSTIANGTKVFKMPFIGWNGGETDTLFQVSIQDESNGLITPDVPVFQLEDAFNGINDTRLRISSYAGGSTPNLMFKGNIQAYNRIGFFTNFTGSNVFSNPTVYISKNGNALQFTDVTNGSVSLTDIKTAINWGNHADAGYITDGNSGWDNSYGFITDYTESDPTVYAWAKAATKPVYAWGEITSKPTFATVATTGSYTDLLNLPTIPTNTDELTNGAGFITDGNTGWDNSYGFITDGNTGWDNSYGFITDGNTGWDNSYGFLTSEDDGDISNEGILGIASSGIAKSVTLSTNTYGGYGSVFTAGDGLTITGSYQSNGGQAIYTLGTPSSISYSSGNSVSGSTHSHAISIYGSPSAGNVIKYDATYGFAWGTAGTGDVTKVGTPVNNQIGIWTGNGTIEGDADFTWDGSNGYVNGRFGFGTTYGASNVINASGADNYNAVIKATSTATYGGIGLLGVAPDDGVGVRGEQSSGSGQGTAVEGASFSSNSLSYAGNFSASSGSGVRASGGLYDLILAGSGKMNVTFPTPPASSGATGVAGTVIFTADYIYICTATNTWKRVALSTW